MDISPLRYHLPLTPFQFSPGKKEKKILIKMLFVGSTEKTRGKSRSTSVYNKQERQRAKAMYLQTRNPVLRFKGFFA